MSQKKREPKWWQVYIMLPLLVGLFYPEMQLPLSETGHIIAQFGILLLILGFMQMWLRANRSALMSMDEEEGYWRINIHDFPAEQLHAWDDIEQQADQRPLIQIPAAGLKGVLSDTFEWEAPEDEWSVFSEQASQARKEKT